MKKIKFYSVVFKDGKKQAIKQEGYTDGIYNYYKSFSTWYAIEPSVGLSVATADTKKEVALKALLQTSRVKDRLYSMAWAIKEFGHLKSEAEAQR